ncbi:speckle-type POZ protein-like [Planococcus citri]|uniref:speckle-type POZ protein-like n=1 Tax=Planococcus citri TaxID=170843 RepID=UPI0031F83ED0
MSSSNCNTVSTFDELQCNSKVRVHKVNYTWTIDNFDFCEAEGSDLFSPEFSASSSEEINWKLKLYPNGFTAAKDTISFFLDICGNVTEKVFAKFEVSALDFQKKKRCTLKAAVKEFGLDGVHDWGFKPFLKKNNDYFKTKLLIDNKLTIYCEIIFSKVCDAVTSNQWKQSLIYPNASACDLSDDFGQLLEHRKLADVILSVNGQEFPAHKNILTARSPVFAAMFAHNAKENKENRVCIDDMNEKVVGDMLRFIYTGKCENLRELATGLLVAADKYDLDRLKMICANELYETLSVENAASILALADMHGVKELRNAAIKFIVSKPTEVLDTEGWKRVRSNFELADEVFSTLAQQLKSKD